MNLKVPMRVESKERGLLNKQFLKSWNLLYPEVQVIKFNQKVEIRKKEQQW